MAQDYINAQINNKHNITLPNLTLSGKSILPYIVLIFSISFFTISFILMLTFNEIEDLEEENLYKRVDVALSIEKLRLQDLLQEYSYWDDAYLKLITKPDIQWADDNIGSYLSDSYGIDFTGAFTGDGQHTVIFIDGEQSDISHQIFKEPGFELLINTARNDNSGRMIASSYINLFSADYLISVGIFRDEQTEIPRDAGDFLVFAQRLDDDLISAISNTYQLGGLHIDNVAQHHNESMMQLVNPLGEYVITLTWPSPSRNGHFTTHVLIPLFLIFIIMSIVIWRIIKNERINRNKLTDELYILASKDYLTGISNRREFYFLADREISRAKRINKFFSIFMIDIDYFKTINDQWGHDHGDSALIELTKIISKNLRDIDIFARMGGEEFAILLPETNRIASMDTAERLRILIGDHDFMGPNKHSPTQLTISIGVAVWNGSEELDDLLNRADDALYHAKRAGRNCSHII